MFSALNFFCMEAEIKVIEIWFPIIIYMVMERRVQKSVILFVRLVTLCVLTLYICSFFDIVHPHSYS